MYAEIIQGLKALVLAWEWEIFPILALNPWPPHLTLPTLLTAFVFVFTAANFPTVWMNPCTGFQLCTGTH